MQIKSSSVIKMKARKRPKNERAERKVGKRQCRKVSADRGRQLRGMKVCGDVCVCRRSPYIVYILINITKGIIVQRLRFRYLANVEEMAGYWVEG